MISTVEYAEGFKLPSKNDIMEALGPFNVDEEQLLYSNCPSNSWKPIPPIDFEGDWLANYAEPGEAFSEYVQLSYKELKTLKKEVVIGNDSILYFLPIVKKGSEWPIHYPSLESLSSWISSFFQRKVVLLDYGTVELVIPSSIDESIIDFQSLQNNTSKLILGRHHYSSKHTQIHTSGLLKELKKNVKELKNAFALVAITCEDLISGDTSENCLFTAGMASMTGGVAVLSFFRYHPQIRMSPDVWHKYHYENNCSNYPFIIEEKKTNTNKFTALEASDPKLKSINEKFKTEFLRRAAKIIAHETCHVLSMQHCIYYHCIMNGTGHLAEDFASPSFLSLLHLSEEAAVPPGVRCNGQIFPSGHHTEELQGIEGCIMV